jgi:hypothetical protein
VGPQLVQYFIHFERGEDRLDEDGGADGATRNASGILSHLEDFVPEAGLEMALELGQVKIGAASTGDELSRIVVEIQTEITKAGGSGSSVHQDMGLIEVPSSWPDHEGGRRLAEPVALSLRAVVGQRVTHGSHTVELPVHDVRPWRRECIFEIGHEDLRSGIERVDHHLAVDRPSDLYSSVVEVSWGGADCPLGRSDRRGVREEIRALAFIEAPLPLVTLGEQPCPGLTKAPCEVGDKGKRRRSKHLPRPGYRTASNLHPRRQTDLAAHPVATYRSMNPK